MGEGGWFIPTIFGLVVVIAGGAFGGVLVTDYLQGKRDRSYKTLDEHQQANAAGRMRTIGGEEVGGIPEEKPNRIGTLGGSAVQFGVAILILIAMFAWGSQLDRRNDELARQVRELDAQVHALAFSAPPGSASRSTAASGDPAGNSPIQTACANLAERLAAAYEKSPGTKGTEALEKLFQNLGCTGKP